MISVCFYCASCAKEKDSRSGGEKRGAKEERKKKRKPRDTACRDIIITAPVVSVCVCVIIIIFYPSKLSSWQVRAALKV